jgi:ribokinase
VLLIQNETNLQSEAARISNVMGLRVFSYAVPFDAAAAEAIHPFIDTLLLSEIEAEQLQKFRNSLFSHPIRPIVSSRFGQSARWTDIENHHSVDVPAVRVTPGDTTGAGDTFAGHLAEGLARGDMPRAALVLAGRDAALKATKKGPLTRSPLSDAEALTS